MIPSWVRADPLFHAPRLGLKGLWLALGVYALFSVSWPTQEASWALWLSDDDLARATAAVVAFGTALAFPLAHYAFAAGQWLRGAIGAALAGVLFVASLAGIWNYYLHQAQANGVAAVEASLAAATTAALAAEEAAKLRAARRQQVEESLARVDRTEAEAVARIDAELARTPQTALLTRRTFAAQRQQAVDAASRERAALNDELRALMAAPAINPQPAATSAPAIDPRPLESVLAQAMGLKRADVSAIADLVRGLTFEVLLVAFVALGLSTAIVAPAKRAAPVRRFGSILEAYLDAVAARLRASIPAPPVPPAAPTPPAPPAPAGSLLEVTALVAAIAVKMGAQAGWAGRDKPAPPEPPKVEPPPGQPKPPRLKTLPAPSADEWAAYHASTQDLAA